MGQVLVFGPMLGDWGVEHFGRQPKCVDSLEFYSMRVEYLHKKLEERQKDAEMQALPSAFVTFR